MGFSIEELSEEIKQSMIDKKIWNPECPVKLEQLKLVRVDHYDFDRKVKQGELIVHKAKAANALQIFEELFALKFPIHQIKLIDQYNGDDALSMTANNSSCFNFRKIAGSDKLSMHSYGLAIDINPLQNPAITLDRDKLTVEVHPKEGMDYLNRSNQRPGMVESMVYIFKKNGFDVWGGQWNDPVDYHHFQVERAAAEALSED